MISDTVFPCLIAHQNATSCDVFWRDKELALFGYSIKFNTGKVRLGSVPGESDMSV